MRKVLRFLLRGIAVLFILILSYLVLAIGGSLIPFNTAQPEENQDLIVFIESNGVHTDIIFPLESDLLDWTKFVDPDHTISDDAGFRFVAFGWGDLEFYQKTPEWNDLKPGIALRSLFLKSPAAMHVNFKKAVVHGENTISIKLTHTQYLELAEFVKRSFELDSGGKPKQISNLHYSPNDAFYKAKGSLNLFYTCNTWTNNALKSSSLKACLWTPFVQGIFYQYQGLGKIFRGSSLF